MPDKSKEGMNQITSNSKLVIHTSSSDKTELMCFFSKDSLEITDSTNISTETKPVSNTPVTQYHGSNARTIKYEIIFDTDYMKEITAKGEIKEKKATDVTEFTKVVEKATLISEKLHRPPIVDFIWGSIKMSGLINKAVVRIVAFDKGGMPVRASIAVEMLEYTDEGKKTSLQSPDRTKSRVMTQDTSMWVMAQNEYGDDDCWREIARANHVMDPLNIPVGTHLKIPAM